MAEVAEGAEGLMDWMKWVEKEDACASRPWWFSVSVLFPWRLALTSRSSSPALRPPQNPRPSAPGFTKTKQPTPPRGDQQKGAVQ